MGKSIEHLVAALDSTLQADDRKHVYLLVDPMLREPFDPVLPDALGCTVVAVPVRHPAIAPDQWPRLIQLRPVARDLLVASVVLALAEQSDPVRESAAGFTIGGWLFSAADAETVARHLAQVMECRPVAGGGRKYLRWADRRVLECLWDELSEAQRGQLLGPISTWLAINRCGEIAAFAPGEPANGDATPHERLRLRSQDWAVASRCETVQQLLRGWLRFHPMLPVDHLRRAKHAVSEALALGLADQQDIVLFGAYLLQVHPQLARHPRVYGVVQQAVVRSIPLGDALAEIPDPEGWNDIRRDLSGQSQPRVAR